MTPLILESVIRGHHVYKSRWTPLLGETLNTSFELDNEHTAKTVWLFQPISWLPQLHFKYPITAELRC